jgi:hypothetical protein
MFPTAAKHCTCVANISALCHQPDGSKNGQDEQGRIFFYNIAFCPFVF